MIVKSKRLVNQKVHKLLTGGEIKEVIVKEDIAAPEKTRVNIFYRGNISSGIIDLSKDEAQHLCRVMSSKLNLLKEITIIKSRK